MIVTDDPGLEYFWIRSWKYLIPFPPPTTTSRFTYRFVTRAYIGVFADGNDGTVMCFVSVAETLHLEQGVDVKVDTPCNSPIVADLSQPGDMYNGHYGSFGNGPRAPLIPGRRQSRSGCCGCSRRGRGTP